MNGLSVTAGPSAPQPHTELIRVTFQHIHLSEHSRRVVRLVLARLRPTFVAWIRSRYAIVASLVEQERKKNKIYKAGGLMVVLATPNKRTAQARKKC